MRYRLAWMAMLACSACGASDDAANGPVAITGGGNSDVGADSGGTDAVQDVGGSDALVGADTAGPATDAGVDMQDGGLSVTTDCQTVSQCKGTPPEPAKVWSCISGKCVPRTECKSDKPCVALVGICDVDQGVCVDCLGNEDCSGNDECRVGQCLPPTKACTSSKQCAELGLICDKQAGVCAECIGAAECDQGYFCSKGVCLPQVCKPKLTKCTGAGKLSTCAADGGSWTDAPCGVGESCADGACKKQVCTPKSQLCKGNKAMNCSDDGLSTSVADDCAKPAPSGAPRFCENGACVKGVCLPNAVTCTDSKLATCTADGSAWVTTSCGAGATCHNGGCIKSVCQPNTSWCAANKLYTCDAKGVSKSLVADCSKKGQTCSGSGANAGCKSTICKPNSATCNADGKTIKACTADGLGTVDIPCPKGNVCLDGACKVQLCTPSKLLCISNAVHKCDATGAASSLLATCGNNKTCIQGACVPVTCTPGSVVCVDALIRTCSANGTVFDDKLCTDGNACTQDKCEGAKCIFGAVKTCDDNNPCTKDVCDTKSGKCTTTFHTGACDDGDKCTASDACAAGKCVGSAPTKCNDGNACTKDTCTPKSGCVFEPVTGACATPDKCAAKAQCVGTTCKVVQTKLCDDNNACTTDSCSAATGQCQHTPAKSCDDKDSCTKDSCDAKTGACVHTKIANCTPALCSTTVLASKIGGQADIIWFVDTSGSMGQESKWVSNNLEKFASYLAASKIDYRIVLVGKSTGCCKVDPALSTHLKAGTFMHVKKVIYSTDGLKKLVSPPYTYINDFKSFLRPGAGKHFVAVTDDDSLQLTGQSFEQQLLKIKHPSQPNGGALFADFVFHSIVAWGPMAHKGCPTGARIGKQYLWLSGKTGGKKLKVCDQNWAPFFKAIADSVAANNGPTDGCSYALPSSVVGNASKVDKLKVSYTTAGGQTAELKRVVDEKACAGGAGYWLDSLKAADAKFAVVCKATCSALKGGAATLSFPCQ